MHNPPLPEHLPPAQRERVAVLTVIHEGSAFSPSEVYRRFDPEPELADLPTLLEGLRAILGPGHSEGSRRVLARVSGTQRPFLVAWRGKGQMDDGTAVIGEPAGFAMEMLLLCDTCPVPEACALRQYCRVNQEAMAVDSPADAPSSGQTQNTVRQSPNDTGLPFFCT